MPGQVKPFTLTIRQRDLLAARSKGLTYPQIAAAWSVSVESLWQRMNRILRKQRAQHGGDLGKVYAELMNQQLMARAMRRASRPRPVRLMQLSCVPSALY